jgi:cytochrome c-type biogenesis protein CcmH
MLFWFIAIAITAIACAALFYAAGRRVVNAGTGESADLNTHLRALLAGIDADQAAGKLGEAEANAAKAELAREVIRLKGDAGRTPGTTKELGQGPLMGGLALIAMTALGLYALLGSPNLPAQPLSERRDVAAQELDLDAAVDRIEQALAANPDDLQGWNVIAPAYLQLGRYQDAANAYRRLIALDGPTADRQTSLAEALLLIAGEAGSTEAVELLQSASASDPTHVMSRLYLGAEFTRMGRYDEAITAWEEALALAAGDEPWIGAARQGLAAAQNDGQLPQTGQEAEMIQQMVSGLAERLAAQGGSVEDWTQLVRAYLVLGDAERAQAAYDDAVAAYPAAFDRGELDTLALGAGLTLNGEAP